jgi:hypothetical protein
VSAFALAALVLAAVFVAVVLVIRRNRRDIETVEPAPATEPAEVPEGPGRDPARTTRD